ncbi:hypothetical protein BOTNAR_0553g00040 [Botryotinia narcissicola]|uniref:NADH dehydrogenase [ubiquinone] 1 alpha subcomplex assembly factor 3 n=1 Tax=Botryotinia narcissicola TaxID=278944 RepID=A0A4Z1HD08_9HELO|nr:hypothetical protein BOTNAR_0553g00040 [Botryotinia narcissicola]
MSRLRKISPSIPEIANAIIAPRSSISTCKSTRLGSCQSLIPRVKHSNPFKVSYHAPYSFCQSRHYSQSGPSKPSTPIKPTSVRTSSPSSRSHSHPPATHDRGPPSSETTQTDFSVLDVLGNTPMPSTSIDACLSDGFHLNSGVKVGGDGIFKGGKWRGGAGVLLVGGEAFGWKPWVGGAKEGEELELVNKKGQFECGDEAWGILGCVWPRPDLLILGLGKDMRPISPKTRAYINGLGIQIEIADTRNAAAQFNLLATERGVGSVAGALMPIGR